LKAEAPVIGSDAFFSGHSEALARLALRYHVPAIYKYPAFTTAGGLMSYGSDVAEAYRVARLYVGRILKGGKPGDLPVQAVTKVYLIINLKTAKALGITLPVSLISRAEEVMSDARAPPRSCGSSRFAKVALA
jgi:putative ABC transport system substrate-binding protein